MILVISYQLETIFSFVKTYKNTKRILWNKKTILSYNQTSAQREYDKKMWKYLWEVIHHRRIVSNNCFKQYWNIFIYKILCFVMTFITLQDNRNKIKILRKICDDSNISQDMKYHYRTIDLYKNVWKYNDDHI